MGGVGKVPESPGGGGSEDEKLCTDSKIDTLFNSADGSTYAFKGMI